MDALEILIRDTLTEHAEQAPPMTRRVPRNAAATHRRSYALGAAAAVAVIAVGAVAIARHSGAGRDAGPAASMPSTTHTTAPPGTKPVSYRGITVDVPEAMQVTDLSCAGVAPGVVLTVDPTFSPKCAPLVARPSEARGTAVVLTPAEVDDQYPHPAGVTASVTTHGNLPVRVTVTAPTRAEADAVLHTVHGSSVDAQGCLATAPYPMPHQPMTSSILPGTPVSATVCDYVVEHGNYDRAWLLGSSTLTATQLSRAQAGIRELPLPTEHSRLDFPSLPSWIVFRYSNGSTHTLLTQRHYSPSYVTDGQHWLYDEYGLMSALISS